MSKFISRSAFLPAAGYSGALAKTQRGQLWDALQVLGLTDTNRVTVTATATLTLAQCGLLLVDASAAAIVLTLPASGAAADEAMYNLRRIDSSANTVTVQRAGTDTVEGGASITLPGNSTTSLQIPGGSANWRVAGISGPTAAAARAALGLANKGFFFKTDSASVAFTKTGAGTVSLKAASVVEVAGAIFTFASDTAVTMPTLAAGADYAIYINPTGTLQAVADPYSAPSAPPVAGGRKIGGFHYGLVAPATTVTGGAFATTGNGMIWTQASVDDIAGINRYSLWDVMWRCAGEQRGMAFDPYVRAWAAIYWCPTNHVTSGISAYNTDVASGSVLPRIPLAYGGTGATNYANGTWWTFGEIAASFGLRHPTEREFMSAAYGVTENQSLGGASVTIPATARQAGYTSRIGLEQASGHIWAWGQDSGMSNITFSWQDVNGGRGQIYTGTHTKVLQGGSRTDAAFSGSRASSWANYPWASFWYLGLRAFGDHLKLA